MVFKTRYCIVDPDSGESISVDEPTTNTRADGSYELEIPVEFDRNGDGRLSDAEGRIVIFGGVDLSTGLPNETVLYGSVESAAVTPLTTLILVIADEADLSMTEADEPTANGVQSAVS